MLPEGLRTAAAAMDPPDFWIVVAVMGAAAAFLLHRGTRAFWRLRTVADTPTARIQSAPQGYVELTGTARPHRAPTAAPLTGLPCLWYRYRVEERRGSGRNRKWVTVESGDCPEPFALDDATGRCLVEPAGAYLHLRLRERWYGAHREPRRARGGWWLSAQRYRFTEERIDDGDPLYILGCFETPRRGPQERDRLRRALLHVWKQDPARLARFDRDGDGMVSEQEWEQARAEAERLAERSEQTLAAKPPTPRVRDTGDSSQPYVISTHTEQDLISSLRWTSFWATAAALALGVAAVLMLLARLHAA